MNLIEKAKDFAHRAHDSIKQKRKYSGEPYWVHTDEVAQLVAEYTVDHKPVLTAEEASYLVAAAHLHDYREDVVIKLREEGRLEELAAFEAEYLTFPVQVRAYVDELTDEYTKENYPQFNRAQRKGFEHDRHAGISRGGKLIKGCDCVSNTRSIVAEDKDFAKVYLPEILDLLGVLAGEVPSELSQRVLDQLVEGYAKIGLAFPQAKS